MNGRKPAPPPRHEWLPSGVPVSGGYPVTADCKPSCCKSPYGHSTVRDAIPPWHKDACHCHDTGGTR